MKRISSLAATTRARSSALLLAALLVLTFSACGRENTDAGGGASARGVTKDSIKIGGSFPFSGPLAVFGGLSKGFNAHLEAVNAKGGVNGRKLEYTTLDDAYDPSRVTSNVRKLVQRENAFMVVDFGAGPLIARPFMEQTKTPQFILGGLQYDPKFPMTRSWWPELQWETEIYGRYIVEQDPDARVGTLAINNEVAPALVAGVERGLGDKGASVVSDVRFEPTQVDLSSQINKLRAAKVDALVTLVTGAAEIQMLKYLEQIDWHPKLFLYSASVSRESILEPAGAEAAKGAYTAMWLKDPSDPRWSEGDGLAQYRKDIAEYGDGAKPDDIIAANGYAAAQAVVGALETMEEPTQDGFMKALDTYPRKTLDLLHPGIELRASPLNHLVTQYQLLRYDGNSYQPIGEPIQVAER